MNSKVQGLIYSEDTGIFKIRELEVSITSKCHLRCYNCGFYIPDQPAPSNKQDTIGEITEGLLHLERLNIRIGSLGILGGEPTFDQKVLETALQEFSRFKNIERIEVITHGLTPQNITKEALKLVNKLTISIYFDDQELITLWEAYIKKHAPNIELCLRTDKEWDKWLGNEIVSDKKAQVMFDSCWYRKHCTTLERQKLFMCSRIAKLSEDQYGLTLNEKTTINDLSTYLNCSSFIDPCRKCVPMMGLPSVKAGVQPDNRILKLIPTAVKFLKAELDVEV